MAGQSSRWIIVLCTCLLAQEFSFASRIPNPKAHRELLKSYREEINADDSVLVRSLEQRQDKRGFGLLLMAVGIGVSLAGIGFEAYLAIKGCCGLYPKACDNKKAFIALQPSIKSKSTKVDQLYLEAGTVLEYVKQCNYKNNDIWLELKRIGQLSEELITSIDPNLVNEFSILQNELKKQVQAKNATVMSITNSQLNTKYDSLFSSAKGTALLLSTIFGHSLTIAGSYAFKQYKVNKIQKTLTTDYGKKLINASPKSKKLFGVTDTNVKAHLRETAVSNYKASMSTSKMSTYLSGANHMLVLFSAGFEIYGAIKKVQGCESIYKSTVTGLNKARSASNDLDALVADVATYKTFVNTKGWSFVKGQISGDNVATVLKDISALAGGAGKQTPSLKNAKTTIDNFIPAIRKADYPTTFKLQKGLITALGSITYVLACQLDKVKLVNYVTSGCKLGHDTLHNLYTNGLKNFKKVNSPACRDKSGVAYTNEADVAKILKVAAAKDGFQFDCLLNNKQTKDQACNYHYQQFTAADIAARMKLSLAQVQYLTASCPPRNFLFPTEKNSICKLRSYGLSDAAIAGSLSIPHLQAQVAAHKCPKPTKLPPQAKLSPAEKANVCTMRGYGVPDVQIASMANLDLALVQATTCP